MTRRACARFFTRVLDLDALLEQVIEQRNAGRALECLALGTDFRVREHLDLRHRDSRQITLSTRLPASACLTLRSIRRAANSPVARLSSSAAARSVVALSRARCARRFASATSIGWRSAGESK